MPLVAEQASEGADSEPVFLPLCDKEYEPLKIRFMLSDDELTADERDAVLRAHDTLSLALPPSRLTAVPPSRSLHGFEHNCEGGS